MPRIFQTIGVIRSFIEAIPHSVHIGVRESRRVEEEVQCREQVALATAVVAVEPVVQLLRRGIRIADSGEQVFEEVDRSIGKVIGIKVLSVPLFLGPSCIFEVDLPVDADGFLESGIGLFEKVCFVDHSELLTRILGKLLAQVRRSVGAKRANLANRSGESSFIQIFISVFSQL